MYKNYIFDLYGTLVDIKTDESSLELFEKTALLLGYKGAVYSAEELRENYYALVEKEKARVHKKNAKYKHIDISLEKVFTALISQKGATATDDEIKQIMAAFRAFSTEYIRLYDGVFDLLETLKSKNKNIYLLSNAQRNFTCGEIVMLGLEKFFDGIIISSDIGISKPDFYFFDYIFKKYNLKKLESIMIGNDSIADILGAKNYGIDSLYIHQIGLSPPISDPLLSNYKILDGDFRKIKKLIV